MKRSVYVSLRCPLSDLSTALLRLQDQLDLAAGVELAVEPGDEISQGDVWAVIHHNRDIPPHLLHQLEGSIHVTDDPQCLHLPRVSRIL